MYSLVLLAVCKPTRGLVTPKERVRELSGSWRDEEKKRSNRAARKRKARKTSSLGSKVSPRRGAYKEGAEDAIPLTPAEYEQYLATVEENQKKLKQWADSAPCNFGHQYLLVEVRPPPQWPAPAPCRYGMFVLTICVIYGDHGPGREGVAGRAKQHSWPIDRAGARDHGHVRACVRHGDRERVRPGRRPGQGALVADAA